MAPGVIVPVGAHGAGSHRGGGHRSGVVPFSRAVPAGGAAAGGRAGPSSAAVFSCAVLLRPGQGLPREARSVCAGVVGGRDDADLGLAGAGGGEGGRL